MLQPGTELQGRYQILRLLGRGGMGAVYEARDKRFETTVAVKDCRFDDPDLLRQFQREARLLARLRHPAVTRVIDHFSENDGHYLVMEYIPGDDLDSMMKKGVRFSPDQVLSWTDQLLDALDYLHTQEHPVIHRDIKPANLKLMPSGQIIMLDFGLAKGSTGATTLQTGPQSVYGYTPNYAPLEQIHGTEGTDARSDLYSLAATMYHLLTGSMPPSTLVRLSKTTEGAPDPLQPPHTLTPAVPPAAEEALMRALAIARDRRPASAREMRAMLRSAAADTRPAPEPSSAYTEAGPTLVVPSGPADGALPRPQRSVLPAVLLLVFTVAAVGLAVLLLLRREAEKPPEAILADVAAAGKAVRAPAHALLSALSRPAALLKGHGDSVRNVAFSPDGKLLASASWDGTVRVWDVASGREIRRITREGQQMTSVAFSRDGAVLAIGGYGPSASKIEFVAPHTGEPVREGLADRSDLVNDVDFGPDGRVAAAVGSTIRFWDQNGEHDLAIPGNVNPSMALSPDGEVTAVAGTNKNSVYLHNRQGQMLRDLQGHEEGILSLAYHPEGRTVASGSYDSTVRVWKVDENNSSVVLSLAPLDKPFSLAYTADGALLVAGTENSVMVWDPADGSQRTALKTGCLAHALAMPPAGNALALGCADGRVLLFN